MEKILQGTIQAAIKAGAATTKSLSRVIVDTTVMEKNVTFPTDAKLYHNGIKTLVRMAKNNNITLRQTYTFLSKRASKKSAQYAHARQMKRAQKERNKLKTYLGRVSRDIKSQLEKKTYLKKHI